MMNLFRDAAVIWKGQQHFGQVRLATPLASWVVTGFLVLLLMAGFAFLAYSQYARKETVYGFVDTALVVKRVVSPRPGVITHLPVFEGQQVEAGDVIAVVETGTNLAPQIKELEFQIAHADARLSLLDQQRRGQEQKTKNAIDATRTSLARANKVVSLQEKKIDDLQNIVGNARRIYESGHLSQLEWDNLRARLVSARQQAEQHAREADRLQRDLTEARTRLDELPVEFDARQLDIEAQRSRLRQARLGLLRESKALISAPVTGEIRTVLKQTGDFVEPARTILVIVPERFDLTATLLIPGTSIGVMEPGRNIELSYDAYPHETFGTFPGRIVHLSNHPVMPREADLPVPFTQPGYLARVEITNVKAYEGDVSLRPGMRLRAEVILESNSLLHWLMASLTPDEPPAR